MARTKTNTRDDTKTHNNMMQQTFRKKSFSFNKSSIESKVPKVHKLKIKSVRDTLLIYSVCRF